MCIEPKFGGNILGASPKSSNPNQEAGPQWRTTDDFDRPLSLSQKNQSTSSMMTSVSSTNKVLIMCWRQRCGSSRLRTTSSSSASSTSLSSFSSFSPFSSMAAAEAVVEATQISETSSEVSDELKDKSSTVMIHSALESGCMDYSRSWAWQQIILNRRLAYKRHQKEQQQQQQDHHHQSSNHADDYDCILFLEHLPVYTLGRGADENHLTFLQDQQQEEQEQRQHHKRNNYDQKYCDEVRSKLSRKVRGQGTARLAIDRTFEKDYLHHFNINNDDNKNDRNLTTSTATATRDDDLSSLMSMVNHLETLACPVIAPNDVPIYRVERGGEVTFHGPSQLVVYPLFDLTNKSRYKQDLHWYLRMIEEVIIQTLQHYDIDSTRDEENTGVWVGNEKIAAVGISSSRWITTHGFALNVNPELSFFDTSVILPCGIDGKGVTSMAKILNDRGDKEIPTLSEVSVVVQKTMEEVFGLRLQHSTDLT